MAPPVTALPLDQLAPSRHQTRRFPRADAEDPYLVELADSVRLHGLLQPILVRPVDGRPTPFEIVAGECRWRASRLAGCRDIAVTVRELGDAEAATLTAVENLKRRNLPPVEAGRAVRILLDQAGGDVAAVAETLSRSTSWVALRARLADLSPSWVEAAEDPAHPVSGWLAASLEVVARHPAETQERVFETMPRPSDRYGFEYQWAQLATAADVARRFGREAHLLKHAPWKLDDASLCEAAGACSACPHRTGARPLLFPDFDGAGERKGDRCLDNTCWARKLRLHVAGRVAALRERHGDGLVLLGNDYEPGAKELHRELGGGVRQPHHYEPAKASSEGAVPVFHVTGHSAGKADWAIPRATSGAAAPKPTTPPAVLAQREERLARRRAKRLSELLVEHLRADAKVAPEHLDLPQLAALVAAVGTAYNADQSDWMLSQATVLPAKLLGSGEDGAWKRFDLYPRRPDDLRADLWRGAAPVLARRLAYGSHVALDRLARESRRAARLLGLDYDELTAEVARAIPEPKSFRELREAARRHKAAAEPAKKPATKKPTAKKPARNRSSGKKPPSGKAGGRVKSTDRKRAATAAT